MPSDAYAQATRPATACVTGSRICREIDPRTGAASSPLPVITIRINGEQNLGSALKWLPYVY
jgi:hypothetical protein